MQKTILIVEDDRSVADGLKDVLATCDYQVFWAQNGAQTEQMLKEHRIHLIILDVHLGAESGYDICLQIRSRKEIPILFLTACSSEMELIRGFQAGGDDYVVKPFRVRELIVRIQALLRRADFQNAVLQRSGDLTVDPKVQQVRKNEISLVLTSTEWKLLALLMDAYPNPVSREELLYQVWDKEALYVEENTLSVNISRLREKIGTYEGKTYIETVRSVGYRWTVLVSRGDRLCMSGCGKKAGRYIFVSRTREMVFRRGSCQSFSPDSAGAVPQRRDMASGLPWQEILQCCITVR